MSNHPLQTVTTSADKAKLFTAIAAVVAGVVGFYLLAGQVTLVRSSALLAGLVVAVAVAWTTALGQSFIGFAREAVRETKKSGLAISQRGNADHGSRVRFCFHHGLVPVGNGQAA